jgi:hypothetical protein
MIESTLEKLISEAKKKLAQEWPFRGGNIPEMNDFLESQMRKAWKEGTSDMFTALFRKKNLRTLRTEDPDVLFIPEEDLEKARKKKYLPKTGSKEEQK